MPKYLDLDGLKNYHDKINETFLDKDDALTEEEIKTLFPELDGEETLDNRYSLRFENDIITMARPDGTTSSVDISKYNKVSSGGVGETTINQGEIFNDYDNNIANLNAHAEGYKTKAINDSSHAEGSETTASGAHSHAEGQYTKADGANSHAEGYLSKVFDVNGHSEGRETIVYSRQGHSEGRETVVFGNQGHAEGTGCKGGIRARLDQGTSSDAIPIFASQVKEFNVRPGDNLGTSFSSREKIIEITDDNTILHLENPITISGEYLYFYTRGAEGVNSHVEGEGTYAFEGATHAEGLNTYAGGYSSHAEGNATQATGGKAHAEGMYTIASANQAHAEGYETVASNTSTHAEGAFSVASGITAHAEGESTEASGNQSHAEGYYSYAIGQVSHAEGKWAYANSDYSHAEGLSVQVGSPCQHGQGKYNIYDDKSVYADIVGNGADSDHRSNAYTLDWQGNGWYANDVYLGSNSGTNKDIGSVSVKQSLTNLQNSINILPEGLHINLENGFLKLYYLDTLLSSCELIGLNPGTSISCVSVQITSPSLIDITTDDTYEIEFILNPSDTTDKVQFLPSNLDLISINSQGVITPRQKYGYSKIRVKCGEASDETTIRLSQYYDPQIEMLNWANYYEDSRTFSYILPKAVTNGNAGFLAKSMEDFILVKAGSRVRGYAKYKTQGYYFNSLYIIEPEEDTVFSYNESSTTYIFQNVVAKRIPVGWGSDIDIIVEKDCYLSAIIGRDSVNYPDFDQAKIDELNAEKAFRILITPPEEDNV